MAQDQACVIEGRIQGQRLGIARSRRVELRLLPLHVGEIDMRRRIVRPDCDGATVGAHGLVQPPEGLQRITEIVARIRQVRLELDGLLIMARGFFETTLGLEQIGEIVVEAAVAGREIDGLAVCRLRLPAAAQPIQHDTHIEPSLGVVAGQPRRLPVGLQRLLQRAPGLEHGTQIVVVGGHLWLLADGAAYELQGTVPVTGLEAGQPQKMQGIRMPGILLDNLLVEAPGARQFTCLVQPDGHLQKLCRVFGGGHTHLAPDAGLGPALSS